MMNVNLFLSDSLVTRHCIYRAPTREVKHEQTSRVTSGYNLSPLIDSCHFRILGPFKSVEVDPLFDEAASSPIGYVLQRDGWA